MKLNNLHYIRKIFFCFAYIRKSVEYLSTYQCFTANIQLHVYKKNTLTFCSFYQESLLRGCYQEKYCNLCSKSARSWGGGEEDFILFTKMNIFIKFFLFVGLGFGGVFYGSHILCTLYIVHNILN